MTQCSPSDLTANDSSVLSAIFDREFSPSGPIPISKTAADLPHISNSITRDLQDQEVSDIQSVNTESPPKSSIESAISNFSTLLTLHPKYAPAYLNRAQATRLLINDDRALFLPQNKAQVSSILSDLSTTISLASPPSPTHPISDLQTALLAKAYTHRGYLLLKASQVAANSPSATAATVLPPQLAGSSSGQLEEMASQDFLSGGKYGNRAARELGIRTNPYAKMCGAIVKEAMKREREAFEKGL